MTKLLRVDSVGRTQQLEPAHFANEVDELQGYISKNPTILGDNITIIAQQLDTGSGKKLDMLALEEIRDSVVRPAIVELKNVEVSTDVLLQVLKYSDWVLGHTDSVRLYAGKSKAKSMELDNTSVKVIIVAPAIKDELLELSNYIVSSVEFGFLQFSRFKDATGDMVILDWKTPAGAPGSTTVVQQEWDWEKYKTDLKISADRINIAKHLFEGLVNLNSQKEWGLTPFFRKYYVPFKKSGYNIVEIDLYTKPCYLSFRLTKQPKELGLPEIHPELSQTYNEKYPRYWFRVADTNIEIADFSEYIEKALASISST